MSWGCGVNGKTIVFIEKSGHLKLKRRCVYLERNLNPVWQLNVSNCRRVFSREGDRKRHRCDSIRSKAAVAGCVSHGNRRIIPEQIVVGGGSVNGDEEVGGGSVVDVSVGTAAVFTKAAAPLVCSVCQRSFLREGDRKRHRCDCVRSRMLSSGSVFQRRTTIEGGIDDDVDEGPSGDVGDGNLIDGHRHVSGLEHGVGRGGGRAGATGDGRDERGGRVGVVVGGGRLPNMWSFFFQAFDKDAVAWTLFSPFDIL